MNNKDFKDFKELNNISTPKPLISFVKIISYFVVLIVIILSITPWQQTSRGFGHITTINPGDRIQNINAPVHGRIDKWFVNDSMPVKKGDKIASIVDNDPLILERLTNERDAKVRKFNVSEIAAQTARIDYRRQEDLHKQGLSAKKDFEKAKIEYKKLLGSMETAAADLEITKTKLARQQTQIITAPKDGFIIKILSGTRSTLVKAGDHIATFAPNLTDPAIELFISGNDIALVEPGRKVRLQKDLPKINFSTQANITQDLEQDIESAQQNRAEIAFLKLNKSRQKASLKYSKNLLQPKLDVNLEVSKDNGGGPDSLSQSRNTVGAQLSLPLQFSQAKGKINQAKSNISAITYEEKNIKDSIKVELEQIHISITNNVKMLNNLKEEVTLAHKLEAAERRKFELGASNFFIVNLREQISANSRIRKIQAWQKLQNFKTDYKAARFYF